MHKWTNTLTMAASLSLRRLSAASLGSVLDAPPSRGGPLELATGPCSSPAAARTVSSRLCAVRGGTRASSVITTRRGSVGRKTAAIC